MSARKEKKPQFKVGDWVSFQWGVKDAMAQVIEDRGPIGVGGRRLYRIQPELEYMEPFEMPEVDLKPTTRPAVQKS